jgi:hypothetical protein
VAVLGAAGAGSFANGYNHVYFTIGYRTTWKDNRTIKRPWICKLAMERLHPGSIAHGSL